MLIEVHILKNYSPSNLNRDDTGSPKDAVFGGIKRARISSQCMKRNIRKNDVFGNVMKDYLGTRTRKFPELIKNELIEKYQFEEENAHKVAEALSKLGKKDEQSDEKKKKKKDKQKLETQLIFFDQREIAKLTEAIADLAKNKDLSKVKGEDLNKNLKKALSDTKRTSADIALFGRMTTGEFLEDVEASMQVAHAIGVSKMDTEYDFFTAVDDLNIGGDSMKEHGAGHLGDTEFTSTTFYKYFSCDVSELMKNLNDDQDICKKTIETFLKTIPLTSPSGKQNSFAAHNPASFLLIELKDSNIPISYANAFLKPVNIESKKALDEIAIDRMGQYSNKIKKLYSIESKTSHLSIYDDIDIESSIQHETLDQMIQWVIDNISLNGKSE